MVVLNWSGYKLISDMNIEVLPAKAGVYKLSTRNLQTNNYNIPFYVGQTSNIKSRIQQHSSDSEQNECIKGNFKKYNVYLNYSLLSLQQDRDSVEVALYNHYKPTCNDKNALPNVQPADVSSFN